MGQNCQASEFSCCGADDTASGKKPEHEVTKVEKGEIQFPLKSKSKKDRDQVERNQSTQEDLPLGNKSNGV